MKSIKSLLVKSLPYVLFAIVVSCSESRIDENNLEISSNVQEFTELDNLLQGINTSEILIVQKNGSIQQALNQASEGGLIYIEPGIYKEVLDISKKDIKLIGIQRNGEQVYLENPGSENAPFIRNNSKDVEMCNIKFKDYPGNQYGYKKYMPSMHSLKSVIKNFSRKELGDGIAHYEFEIMMDTGVYDVVKIHRVVKEFWPYRPVKTQGNIFMVHGAIQDFDDIFLTAGAELINSETSAPYFLATQGIDVWGIDLGWTRVPLENDNYNFMSGWGIEKDVIHTLKAMTVARLIRGKTGSGFGPMNLLGFSYGVNVAYGAAGRETNTHPLLRNVKGIIPVDYQIKSNDEAVQQNNCVLAENHLTKINEGQYHNPYGVGLIQLGSMALNDPDALSVVPGFEGLTNMQMINAIATDHSSGFHYLGGTPFELYYTESIRFIRLCAALSPHMPRQLFYEMCACDCPDMDVSFDDNLSKIKIPIFNISSQGGEGALGDFTSTLTKSKEITYLNIDDPEKPTELDFGHADLWMGYSAAKLVWEPLKNWLIVH